MSEDVFLIWNDVPVMSCDVYDMSTVKSTVFYKVSSVLSDVY